MQKNLQYSFKKIFLDNQWYLRMTMPLQVKCRNEHKDWKDSVRAQGGGIPEVTSILLQNHWLLEQDYLFHYTNEKWVTQRREKESGTDPIVHSNSEIKAKWPFFSVHFLASHCAWEGLYPSSQQYNDREVTLYDTGNSMRKVWQPSSHIHLVSTDDGPDGHIHLSVHFSSTWVTVPSGPIGQRTLVGTCSGNYSQASCTMKDAGRGSH